MNDARLRRRRDPSAARAARLVWLVVLLGLGTGVFTLAAVRVALQTMRQQRSHVTKVHDAIDDVVGEIGRDCADARNAMERTLSLQATTEPGSPSAPDHWALRMRAALDALGHNLTEGATIAQNADNLRRLLADLQALDGRCADWSREYRACQTGLIERKRVVDASLLALRAALNSADGHQRLEMAIKVRQFRKLSGPLAEEAAAQVVEKLEPGSDLGEFAVELFGVESLCERLVGEEEIDRLSNLKDNLFAAALQRLESIIGGAVAGSDDASAMTKPFTTFKDALLGAGYAIDADHQTITPGEGGLYALCRRRLELRQQRDLLRDAVARGAQEYKTALDRFDAASDELRDRITSQAEAGLSRTWSGLLIACAACGGLLLLLGTFIARTIRRQIVAIQRTTAELAHSNAQMAAIHETSLDAIIVMDSDGRIVEFSRSAERALGFSRGNVIGKDLADTIMPPSFRERHRQGLAKYLATGQSAILNRRVEVAVSRADGSEFPAELTVARADVEGKPLFTAFIRDLSDQKRAESEREQLHNRLLSASRQAGMAEVATGVLHNVGNVLNSVNVSASVVAERLRKSEIASLQKASDLLREHQDDLPQYLAADERGRHLPAFLIEVASYLADEQKDLLAEMESVGRGLDHIKHIVGAQQAHAKRGGGVLLQRVRPAELMEMALDMQRESFQRHQVQIERRFDDDELAEVPLDKHRTLQILVNLLANAKDAVREGRRSDRQITVALEIGEAALDADGALRPVVRFVIQDNGIGIAPENLAKVFAHGFTTRDEGHGFGLHSAANAAREMGGNLTAISDGPGRGAAFTLELPIKRLESFEITAAVTTTKATAVAEADVKRGTGGIIL